MTYSFCFVEVIHTYIPMVMTVEINEVDGGTYPQIKAWYPHQDCVLEALGKIWVASVPRCVPILKKRFFFPKRINPQTTM